MVTVRDHNEQTKYTILFSEGDQLEIKVNSVSKFDETVPAGKDALVDIVMRHYKPGSP